MCLGSSLHILETNVSDLDAVGLVFCMMKHLPYNLTFLITT